MNEIGETLGYVKEREEELQEHLLSKDEDKLGDIDLRNDEWVWDEGVGSR